MNYLSRSIHFFLLGETAPCDIYFYFRGRHVTGLAQNAPISFEFLEKIHKAKYLFVQIKKTDAKAWDAWVAGRYARLSAAQDDQKLVKQAQASAKRAEYLSYILKTINIKKPNDTVFVEAWEKALWSIQSVVQHPILNWYYQQPHEPADLFLHSARVVGTLALFTSYHGILEETEVDAVLLATLLHELQGDPLKPQNLASSVATLETLELEKRRVAKNVLELIEKQDELCSGKGFPNNLRSVEIPISMKVFSLFNHYDHYRLAHNGSRRVRHDAAKAIMEKRKADFDSNIWPLFWQFLEQQVDILL
jgi:hypothetical protein